MSSKIIRMQRPAQGELSEIAARLEKELWRAERKDLPQLQRRPCRDAEL